MKNNDKIANDVHNSEETNSRNVAGPTIHVKRSPLLKNPDPTLQSRCYRFDMPQFMPVKIATVHVLLVNERSL